MQFSDDIEQALAQMAEHSPNVVITLGNQGLIWQRGSEQGRLAAVPINAIDTSGAGDAFHSVGFHYRLLLDGGSCSCSGVVVWFRFSWVNRIRKTQSDILIAQSLLSHY